MAVNVKASVALSLIVLALATAPAFAAPTPPPAPAPAGLRFAPSADGHVGAWLLAGPFRVTPATKSTPLLDVPVPGVDEAALAPRKDDKLGDDALPWQLAPGEGWGIDLKSALGLTNKDKDVIAYAGLVFEAPRRARYTLLLGVDDGVRVIVDGRPVFTRDEPRSLHEDVDTVPLDLGAGAHTIVLKLHQRDGAFGMRTRLMDDAWRAGGTIVFPGAGNEEIDKLVRRLSTVVVDRGMTENGYEPRVTVRFPEGLPAAHRVTVNARIVAREGDVIASAPPVVMPARGADAGSVEISLPAIEGDALARVEDRWWNVEVDVGGRLVKAPFVPRKATRLAARRALFALSAIPTTRPAWLQPGSFESVDALRRRLSHLVSHGDVDVEAQAKEARELDAAAAKLEAQHDPFDGRTGFLRRAYRSPVDGELAPYALYVPDSYRASAHRSYPLIVALHGLNGKPMAMLRWFFGGDDPKKDQEWEDRHMEDLPPLDAFVLAPSGHGNSMYRQLGQDDVMRALEDVTSLYPIDASRITITGPSMGGIGAAALAFRHPDKFAASAPLCGYHSVFVRGDVRGKRMRPWEKFLAEERSNVSWAWNGRDLPLFIVHGTQDLPVENSGALIDRYEALKYSVEHEHPVLGHNVWQPTYEDLKGAKWLLGHTRNLHPPSIRFRTARLRESRDAWAEIEALAAPDAWGELEARVRSRTRIDATTHGIAQLRFDRDDKLIDPNAPLEVALDGTILTFPPGQAVQAHREGEAWKTGPRAENGVVKRAGISGPLRDIFHEPILFVYGASDPAEARANEEVAHAFARIRYGVDVRWPVMSDREFIARGEPLANDRALFLVGAAHSNEVLRALESELPVAVARDHVRVGEKKLRGGRELGAAFITPNPRRPDRYVAVVAGANALGTFRALSLPDLVPDFVVYDERVAPAHGQMVLGAASVIAAGFFGNDWSLPTSFADSFGRTSATPPPPPKKSDEPSQEGE